VAWSISRADRDDPPGPRPPGRVLAPPLSARSRRLPRSAHEYTGKAATNPGAAGWTMLHASRGVTITRTCSGGVSDCTALHPLQSQ